MTLLPTDHTAALAAAVASISATDVAALDEPVPTCGDWTVADVILHTSMIHRWATGIVATHAQERPHRDGPADLAGAAVIDHFVEGAAGLTAAFAASDPDEVLYAFVGPRPVSWWMRRQAQETVVHAWDAQLGAGNPQPIDAPIAVDGIDELFDVFVPRLGADRVDGHGETLHLHATDAPGEWLLRFDPDRIDITHEHGKGDAAVRATASDLLLFAWSRLPPTAAELTTFGDAPLLARYQSIVSF